MPGQTGNRIWLVSKDEVSLLQLQSDRFVFNWRRRGDSRYPSFEPIFSEFGNRFTTWRDLVNNRGSDYHLQPQQLELTYTNWLADDHTTQTDVLTLAAVAGSVRIPGAETNYEPAYAIGNYTLARDGIPAGRLALSIIGNAVRSVGVTVQRGSTMSISYFTELEPGIPDERLTETIAFGRYSIVSAFDQLTTSQGHSLWGRI